MCTNQTKNTPHAASTTLLQNKNTKREYPSSSQTWSEIPNAEGNTLQYGPWLLQWTTFTLKKMWLHTKIINMIVDQKVHVQIVHYKGHHGSNMKPRNFFWVCKIFGFWAKNLTNTFNTNPAKDERGVREKFTKTVSLLATKAFRSATTYMYKLWYIVNILYQILSYIYTLFHIIHTHIYINLISYHIISCISYHILHIINLILRIYFYIECYIFDIKYVFFSNVFPVWIE